MYFFDRLISRFAAILILLLLSQCITMDLNMLKPKSCINLSSQVSLEVILERSMYSTLDKDSATVAYFLDI